jgi:hypothetical protein
MPPESCRVLRRCIERQSHHAHPQLDEPVQRVVIEIERLRTGSMTLSATSATRTARPAEGDAVTLLDCAHARLVEVDHLDLDAAGVRPVTEDRLSSTDLPLPEPPTMPNTSPGCTSKLTPSCTTCVPKRFTMLSMRMIAVMARQKSICR